MAFILHLYGAEPLDGLSSCHGRKAGALVHIGAVDAPVTVSDVEAALDECVERRQRELHVLGWDWEMGIGGPNRSVRGRGLLQRAAKQRGVRLLMLQIPREVMEGQAVADGDLRFFELAYLRGRVEKVSQRRVRFRIQDFVIPNMELIPEEVREKIERWSDYMDYWAVDWNFRDDTFRHGFVAYRTRRRRVLPLVSDEHRYPGSGRYRVVVKVIDVFGNDTSQSFEVSV